MNVNNFSELLQEIRSESLDGFAERIADKLRENIQEMWYDVYEPEDYTRTFELLNSVEIKETKAGRQIFINEETMFDGDRQDGHGWTEHIGVTDDRVDSFADMLAENAIGNPKGRNPRANFLGGIDTNFFEATDRWVDENIRQEILDYTRNNLKKYGIKSKISTGKVANIKGNLQTGIRIKI